MDADLDMFEEAMGYFMQAFTRPRSWEAIQRTANITIDRPSVQLLIALQQCTAGSKLHELAAKLGIEAPSVTRTVQRLEQDNMVARTTDPNDKRATHLRITPLGERTLQHIRHAKRKKLEALFADWSAADRTQLAHMLHRLAVQATDNSHNE